MEIVDVADLGSNVVGTRAEDSSESFSDAFSKVLLLDSDRVAIADRVKLVADCDSVGIDGKQINADKVAPRQVVVVVEFEVLGVFEEIAHYGDTRLGKGSWELRFLVLRL
jgi:hypothetical protein